MCQVIDIPASIHHVPNQKSEQRYRWYVKWKTKADGVARRRHYLDAEIDLQQCSSFLAAICRKFLQPATGQHMPALKERRESTCCDSVPNCAIVGAAKGAGVALPQGFQLQHGRLEKRPLTASVDHLLHPLPAGESPKEVPACTALQLCPSADGRAGGGLLFRLGIPRIL